MLAANGRLVVTSVAPLLVRSLLFEVISRRFIAILNKLYYKTRVSSNFFDSPISKPNLFLPQSLRKESYFRYDKW